MFEWAAGLDMTWGSLKASGALIEVTVDVNVAKFPVLETGFVVMRVVTGERCVVVAACPPDFSVSDSNLFLLGQRR